MSSFFFILKNIGFHSYLLFEKVLNNFVHNKLHLILRIWTFFLDSFQEVLDQREYMHERSNDSLLIVYNTICDVHSYFFSLVLHLDFKLWRLPPMRYRSIRELQMNKIVYNIFCIINMIRTLNLRKKTPKEFGKDFEDLRKNLVKLRISKVSGSRQMKSSKLRIVITGFCRSTNCIEHYEKEWNQINVCKIKIQVIRF